MLNYKLMPISLILFDGEGGGADGNGNGQGVSAPAVSAKKAGEFDNVVFGKQAEATAEAENNAPDTQEMTPEQRQADFDAFIEQNKDLYEAKFSAEFQKKFDKRFRENKQREARFNQADEILGILAQRYGENDAEKLKEKILSDDRLLEEEAEKQGISPEQLRNIQNLKAQAEYEKRRADELFARQQGDRQYAQWAQEAEALKGIYPEFDLQSEIQNPRFMSLLKSSIPMEHAYKVIHMDEIMQNNAQRVALATSKATADDIRARGSRPKENAGAATPGIIYKTDVSKLTKEDRAEIAKRAARGEKISF